MRCALAAGLLALSAFGVLAQPAAPGVVLEPAIDGMDASARAQVWIDESGEAGITRATSPGLPWQPLQPDQIFVGGRTDAVWLRFRVTLPPAAATRDWLLELPTPILDLATVHVRLPDGNWQMRSAGDTLPVASWPNPGRYPSFRLDELRPGATTDVYVRLRHLTPISVPVRFSSLASHEQRIQTEYVAMGGAFGALLLLVIACLLQAWVYRDRTYFWYSVYALLMTMAVAAYTGAAGHLLWPHLAFWTDMSQGTLGILAAGSACLFVRHLVGDTARQRGLRAGTRLLGLGALPAAVVFLVIPKGAGMLVVGAYIAVVMVTSLSLAALAWRRGDEVGKWLLVAYLPLAASVVLVLLRVFGWLPISFSTQYSVIIGSVLEVPLLLVALSMRSRDRHSAMIREQALSTQDALTGLLAPHLFHDRLRQVIARHKRDGDSAAVVFIDLVNHARIKEVFGSAVAEQSLLRSVIKLRRLLRDVDTVSRVGEARFGLILEGVGRRTIVTDRAARLIAAGLMPLEGLKPDVTLQFHVGALLLDERQADADQIPLLLSDLLAGMSPRTRRPIRFVAPVDTHPTPLDADSVLLADDDDRSRPLRVVPPSR